MISFPTSRAGKIILSLCSVLVALSVAESFLRWKNYQPGFKTRTRFFREVDSLFILNGYEADSNGITRISSEARELICAELKDKKSSTEIDKMTNNPPQRVFSLFRKLLMIKGITKYQSKQVFSLISDYKQLNERGYKSPFKTFLNAIQTTAVPEERELIDAIHSYVECPININGFKSIEFKRYNTKRKSILLLGDSFTWGNSAENKTDGFADLLLAKGYVVYNSAISGTDPAQYLEIAKIYIPKLKPDYVVVNFCMGNDIYYFERKLRPYQPIFFSTNAGYLLACPEGVYFNNEREAYEHTLRLYAIPDNGSIINRLCSKTAITSLLWNLFAKMGIVNAEVKVEQNYDKSGVRYYQEPYSDVQLKGIKEISEQNDATFILVAIPVVRDGTLLLPKDVKGLFNGLEYFVPPVTTQNYVKRMDGHYNEQGHAIHAEFIDSLIQHDMNTRKF